MPGRDLPTSIRSWDSPSSKRKRQTPRRAPRGTLRAPPRWLDHDPTGEDEPDGSSELEIATARGDADDDVHFGVAAKALGVSRKTVERMVKRGLLERGPSGAPATVSKRGLVTALEQRRRDVSHLTRATEVERAQTGYDSLTAAWPDDAISELQELLRPVLEPLLAEFVDARTRAAVLESQMERITERAEQERGRDELLLVLATGGWRQRRRARRAALAALRASRRPLAPKALTTTRAGFGDRFAEIEQGSAGSLCDVVRAAAFRMTVRVPGMRQARRGPRAVRRD